MTYGVYLNHNNIILPGGLHLARQQTSCAVHEYTSTYYY
jgi:hypothetical protein